MTGRSEVKLTVTEIPKDLILNDHWRIYGIASIAGCTRLLVGVMSQSC